MSWYIWSLSKSSNISSALFIVPTLSLISWIMSSLDAGSIRPMMFKAIAWSICIFSSRANVSGLDEYKISSMTSLILFRNIFLKYFTKAFSGEIPNILDMDETARLPFSYIVPSMVKLQNMLWCSSPNNLYFSSILCMACSILCFISLFIA